MLITKFNKLIHKKIVWAAFAIMISVAMVGMFAPSTGRGKRSSVRSNSMGTVFGKPVSRREFNAASLFTRHFQPLPQMSDKEREDFNKQVWQRIAILKMADKMGVTVSKAELSARIQNDPALNVNGHFDKNRYKLLVREQMHVLVPTFEEYLRQEMILRKMSALVTQSVWVSPLELDSSVKQLTDIFNVEIIHPCTVKVYSNISICIYCIIYNVSINNLCFYIKGKKYQEYS